MANMPATFVACEDFPGWEMAVPWERGADTNGGHAFCTMLRRIGGELTIPVEAGSYGTLFLAAVKRLQELTK